MHRTSRRSTSGFGVVVVIATLLVIGVPANAAALTQPARRASVAQSDEGGTFVPIGPKRLLDTRRGLGGTTPGPRGTVHLQITGRAGVPVGGVSSVVLTFTAVRPGASGFVTAFADGSPRPTASNVNLVRGRTVSNSVVVGVNGATGKVALYNGSAAATPLVADISGYYRAGTPSLAGAFTSLRPSRILDTRTRNGGSTPTSRAFVPLQVTGRGGVPSSGVSAVVLNVATIRPDGKGFIAVYASGSRRPVASNLNFVADQTVANMVVAPVGDGGKVSVYNGSTGSAPLIADVAGYFRAGTATARGTFHVVTPTRLLDTRSPNQVTRPASRHTAVVGVAGEYDESTGAVPGNTDAIVMNVAVANADADGFVEAWPYQEGYDNPRPGTSTANFVRRQTTSTLAITPVKPAGEIAFYNGSPTTIDLVVDVVGYFNVGVDGTVTGAVTDASDGTPLHDVIVEITKAHSNDSQTALTDRRGRYEVANLPVGNYSVRTIYDYDRDTGGSDTRYQPSDEVATVTVTAGEVTDHVDFGLQPGGGISGTLRASFDHGKSEFAPVVLFDGQGAQVQRTVAIDQTTGRYRVVGLAPGSYTVCFGGVTPYAAGGDQRPAQCYDDVSWSGSGPPPAGTTPVSVTVKQVHEGIDADL